MPVFWLAFAVLVMTGAWLFLRACALDAIGLDFCPVDHAVAEARAEAAVGRDLAEQVHSAQMAVAESPICALPTPPPPAHAPPRQAATDDMDRKVVERGGQNGSLQFTLSWATRDDLDLNVDCPGGRLSSRNGEAGPGICGDGRKDIDANRNLTENVSSSPIENIVWHSDVPEGRYKIEVIEYRAATNLGNTVPFTLRIRWRDQERVCSDSVTDYPPLPPHHNAKGELVGGIARTLAWTLRDGLPNCNLEAIDVYKNGAPK